MSILRLVARILWGSLAAADAALLLFFAWHYGWREFDLPNASGPAGGLPQLLVGGVLLVEKAFVATVIALVGAGIIREFTGRRARSLTAAATSVALGCALAGVALLFVTTAWPILDGRGSDLLDRITAFDLLAERPHRAELSGLAGYRQGSVAGHLAALLGAGYLAEKYLVQAWRVRWPVPVLGIAAVAWIVTAVLGGEQAQREWVAGQQWHPLAEVQPLGGSATRVRSPGAYVAPPTALCTEVVPRDPS